MVKITSWPNTVQLLQVSAITRPVTQDALVAVNRQSRNPWLSPDRLAIGSIKSSVPIKIITKKPYAINCVWDNWRLGNIFFSIFLSIYTRRFPERHCFLLYSQTLWIAIIKKFPLVSIQECDGFLGSFYQIFGRKTLQFFSLPESPQHTCRIQAGIFSSLHIGASIPKIQAFS